MNLYDDIDKGFLAVDLNYRDWRADHIEALERTFNYWATELSARFIDVKGLAVLRTVLEQKKSYWDSEDDEIAELYGGFIDDLNEYVTASPDVSHDDKCWFLSFPYDQYWN